MKKLLYLFIVSVLLWPLQASAQPQYEYTTATSTTNTIPFQSGATANLRQWVFYPSDFLPAPPAGTITKVYFKSGASATSTFTTFTVKLGHTSLSTFTAGPFVTAGMVTVFNGPITLTPILGNWMEVTLQTPFAYDNTQNLIIEASQTGYSPGFTIPQATANVASRSIYGGIGSATGSTQDRLGHVGFDLITGPPCNPITGLVVSGISPPTANLSWNPVTGAQGYEYVVNQTATPPGAPGTPTAATSATVPGLVPSTTYYAHVRTICGPTSISGWTTVSFNTNCTAPPPVITPAAPLTLCAGSAVDLAATPAGGTWSSSNPSVATVNSSTGEVSAFNAGAVNILYTITAGTCTYTAVKNIPVTTGGVYPGVISGNENVCMGANTTFSILASGGAWSSTNSLVATVDAAGVVTPVGLGTAFIEYIVPNPNGCPGISLKAINVVPSPPAPGSITGDLTVCLGSSSMLSNSVSGGVWSSGHPPVASINNATGLVNGHALGNSLITYTTSLGSCHRQATAMVEVTPLPIPIVVENAGTLATASTWAGYSWSKDGVPIAGANSQTYVPTGSGTYMVTVTDANGCTGSSKGVFNAGQWLHVSPAVSNAAIVVYPNPAKTKVFVMAAGAVNLTITSVDGKLLLSREGLTSSAKDVEMDVSGFAAGAYFLRVSDASGNLLAVEKLMINN